LGSFNENMIEYRKQLEQGSIRQAYKGLMEYIMDLRIHLQKKYPDYSVSGNIYYGYMDMTYFSFTPEQLKNKKLKIAIVFQHKSTSYEIWLAGYNKQIQTEYWNLFKEKKFSFIYNLF
jgi:hypothetical protein